MNLVQVTSCRIRPYRWQDAVALSALFYRSVTKLGRHKYSPAQVAAWASRTPTPARMHALASDGRIVLVAEAQDHVLAYGHLESDGHVDHLYALPEAAGLGFVDMLYDALEESAVAAGITECYTEASELARSFFVRKGYALQERREFQIMGVTIHNYAMRKTL